MKLPKGAEFKYEFPSKRKKLKNPDPERLDKRKLELDHYFGDLSEWGRSNGMAVRLPPRSLLRLVLTGCVSPGVESAGGQRVSFSEGRFAATPNATPRCGC